MGPPDHPARLLARLDAIGRALEQIPGALALIGLGSVGIERQRLDDYSDLDFFVLVEPELKPALLADNRWLEAVHPVDFAFANTADGSKLLFADGVFCEFAVFTPAELAGAAYAPGALIWARPEIRPTIAAPARPSAPPAPRPAEWLLGEALTNLYVGMGRERRGERLSAARFIQGYAVDRVLELVERDAASEAPLRDPYALERRIEARRPELAAALPQMVQGYTRNAESALATLAFLEARYPVSAALAARIRALCGG